MGYYATASGSAMIIKGCEITLEAVLANKYDKEPYCKLAYYFSTDIDGNRYIEIGDSDKYHEEDTEEFLSIIAPYISDGCLEYCGEDNCIWRFFFDPDTRKWNEESANIDYHCESYSDEELIQALEKRGYSVTKAC